MKNLVIGAPKLAKLLGKKSPSSIYYFMKPERPNPIPHTIGPMGTCFDMEEVQDWLQGVDTELKQFIEDLK